MRWSRRRRPRGEEAPPRGVSVRTLILGLVVLVAFVVLAPTLRAFVTQSEQQRRVDAEHAAVQADVERLEQELLRWQDPAYIQAQARDRLSYVMPGEMAYRVIDPETVEPQTTDDPVYRGLAEPEAAGPAIPWYLTVWGSVVEAGHAELPGQPEGGTADEPAAMP